MNKNLRTDRDKLVHLVSIIDGYKLSNKNIISSVLVLTELATILSKVVYQQASNDPIKKQKLIEEVYSFSTPHSFSYQLTDLIVDDALSNNSDFLDKSDRYLTEAQKFLLIAYCCKLLLHIKADREQIVSLKESALKLNLDNKLILALETVFIHSQKIEPTIFKKIERLLEPVNFKDLDKNIIKKATDTLTVISHYQQNQKVTVESSETDKQKVLADIGIIAALDVKIYHISQILQQKTIDLAFDYWKNWLKNSKIIIENQSNNWTYDFKEEYQLFRWYVNKLKFCLQKEITQVVQESIGNKIIVPLTSGLDREINSSIERINILLFQSQVESISKIKTQEIEHNLGYKLDITIDYSQIKSSLQQKELVTVNTHSEKGNAIAQNIKNFGDKLFSNSKEERKQNIKQLTIDFGLREIARLESDITRHIEKEIIKIFDRKIERYRKQITKAILMLELAMK